MRVAECAPRVAHATPVLPGFPQPNADSSESLHRDWSGTSYQLVGTVTGSDGNVMGAATSAA